MAPVAAIGARMRRRQSRRGSEETWMSWKKPRITEICLGLEINAYASATV
ncbi:pyrroloquinoline quinone precursor peptide PqqA [Paracraurococcus lichenis]|uniref:Coenzyme PQQ synthesis protein A n=1 Tax=Paracraurococcus lichenis TaxID=3064888 RepID=A0ABT9E0P8_9PROT|nr:pyrroloquinoline quinone precursor peptide PqqA [Paracraurococcus sp. LOR1-02]MDO9709735.1 pyrroloquinoline quinone precursor peptide PqqA [Paracraurococcus sp. LOR1-02]